MSLRTEESQPKRVLKKLNFLVHFGFDYDQDIRAPIAARRQLHNYVLERMTPKSSNELTLVMPFISVNESGHWNEYSLRDDRFNAASLLKEEPEASTWKSIASDLRRSSGLPNNVRLTRDIVGYRFTPQNVLDRIGKQGFTIDAQTEIIFGGQWTEACVLSAAWLFLEQTSVSEVKIDRLSSLPSPQNMDLSAPGYGTTEAMTEDISSFFKARGYTVQPTDSYFTIKKKK